MVCAPRARNPLELDGTTCALQVEEEFVKVGFRAERVNKMQRLFFHSLTGRNGLRPAATQYVESDAPIWP